MMRQVFFLLATQLLPIDTDGDRVPDLMSFQGDAPWQVSGEVGSAGQCLCLTADGAAPSWETVSGGGGGSGIGTLDFGAYPGDPIATLTITGQTGILSGSVVQAWIYPADTADHSLDEHRIVDMRVTAHNIVAGTGFTITGFYVGSGLHDLLKGSAVRRGDYPPPTGERTSGEWSIAWRWQ